MHKTHGCVRLADVATTTQLSSTVVDCPVDCIPAVWTSCLMCADGCSCCARCFLHTALRKNPEERPTVLDMVHHPWVDLYRMRRSMRQLDLTAGAPTAATSTFTTSQVAAAAAAAGAAIGAANVSASCPSLANLSQLLATAPQVAAQEPAASPGSSEQQGPMSAAAAAAAAINAVKKNLKQSVASKMIAGAHALQGKPAEPSKLGSKEDLHAQLSSVSSPCLLTGNKPRGPNNLLKAAVAGSNLGPALPSPPPAAPAATAVTPAPAGLLKGGSLKLDADARTFLFASAYGPGGAPHAAAKTPPGQLTAAPKPGGIASTPKLPPVASASTFRAAQH